MTNFRNARILVTGASGQLATHVLKMLDAQGARHVTAGSRDPARISGPAESKVRVDFEDPASLGKAFEGIDRLLIVSTDALGEPGKRVSQHKAAIESAARAGVGHILYTSMTNPGPESLIPFAPDHRGSEEAIIATGHSYTILRNNWYFDNLLLSLPQVLATGRWYTAAGEGQVGYVTRLDCAAAAAGALLTEDKPSIQDITGPAALSVDALATATSQQLGKPIEVVQVSGETLAAGMRDAGVPAPLVALMVAFDATVRAGQMNVVSDAVKRLAGRESQGLNDWLAANRAALAG